MNMIVTGSLGNVGKPLTETLVQKGHAVTVISSSPERQKDIEALGAGAAIGSLQDADFLTSTFTGADAVFALIPPNFQVPDVIAYYQNTGKNYAQAVQASGVKRVVHLSSWGAHLDHGTGVIVGSHEVENALNELTDVAVTHLRAGSFYTNLYGFIGAIKGQGMISSNYGGDDKVAWVHPKDIAVAAAEELEKPSSDSTRYSHVRYVASDERSASETAQVLGAAIGKPDLEWKLVSGDDVRAGFEGYGMPTQVAKLLVDLNASIHSGAIGEDYEKYKPVLGQVKVEDFAKEFAATFNA